MGLAAGILAGFIVGAAVWQICFVRYCNRRIKDLEDELEKKYNVYIEKVVLPSTSPPKAPS
jgi:protein-S-isoprenylcysteine O-methyltransferase Ste14